MHMLQGWTPAECSLLVSVCCITYNHANFMRDTIESFLMQKTDFPIELLVHDNASTDGTADIVRRCQLENPQLIRAVLQSENQWLQEKRPSQLFHQMARRKYIALCEGDDYRTDSLKLQKQIDFLESRPDFSICCHGVTFQYDDRTPSHYKRPPVPKKMNMIYTTSAKGTSFSPAQLSFAIIHLKKDCHCGVI